MSAHFCKERQPKGGHCPWAVPEVPPVVHGAKPIPPTRIVFLGRASYGPKGPTAACSIPRPAAGESGHQRTLGGRVTSCQLWDMPGHPPASSCLHTTGHTALEGARCAHLDASSALATGIQGAATHPPGMQGSTLRCQGTAGIPCSWFLICPWHTALAPTSASGFGQNQDSRHSPVPSWLPCHPLPAASPARRGQNPAVGCHPCAWGPMSTCTLCVLPGETCDRGCIRILCQDMATVAPKVLRCWLCCLAPELWHPGVEFSVEPGHPVALRFQTPQFLVPRSAGNMARGLLKCLVSRQHRRALPVSLPALLPAPAWSRSCCPLLLPRRNAAECPGSPALAAACAFLLQDPDPGSIPLPHSPF